MGSVSGNTIVNAAGNVDLRINNVSQWLINTTRLLPRSTGTLDIGDYYRRVRTLHASELYVETLVAQGVLATIGGRIVVAPTTRLIADVTLAATTIDVAHNNLVNGAYIYLNAAPNSFAQLEAMQVTSAATTIGGGYRYTVTRNLDGSGANAWNVGDAVVSLGSAVGQGYIDLSSTSTIHNHYGPAQTMYVRTSTATWNGVKPVTTTGNLRSFVDYSADEFGFATGNDLTLTPATGFRGVTVDRTNGVRLFNTDIRLYSGATLQASFDYADGLNMLADSSASARRQQINWWSNMADRSGIPLTELYTYVNAVTGPTLTMKTRAAPGTNGVLMELIAIGNSAVAGSIYISEDSSAVKKVVLDSNNVHLRYNSTDRLWRRRGEPSDGQLCPGCQRFLPCDQLPHVLRRPPQDGAGAGHAGAGSPGQHQRLPVPMGTPLPRVRPVPRQAGPAHPADRLPGARSRSAIPRTRLALAAHRAQRRSAGGCPGGRLQPHGAAPADGHS